MVPVLEGVVQELQEVNPGRIIESHLDTMSGLEVDRMRIAQLLSNLLANALTHGMPDKPVVVQATTRDAAFELSVINHGPPIPEFAKAQLFKPLFKGDGRTKTGLGLGLYMASEIAKAHGGTLGASSDGALTVFTFRMPLGNEGRKLRDTAADDGRTP